MEYDENGRLSREEYSEALGRMFPGGPVGEDVIAELAPKGWEAGGLLAVSHPSPERLLEEAVRLHRTIESLLSGRSEEPPEAEPTMAEIMESYKETAVDADDECADIVGKCLWDIFSDNHDVIAADGRLMELGSFRGTGGTLARWFNELLGERKYDYLDFYMGTARISGRADLSPIYRMIFRRLLKWGFDWRYSFPRIGLVSFGGGAVTEPGYDPSKAFEREQAEVKKRREIEEMRESLRESYNEAVQEARKQPAPETAKAYMNVYGKAPEGWPPLADEGQEE